jgi:two-component system, sensor histidine kinase PdtaS
VERHNSRLILSVSLLFLIAVIGLSAAFLWRGYADALGRAEVQASAAAGAVAAQARWLLEAGSQTLRRAEEAAAGEQPAQALARLAADLPRGFELSVRDREGRTIFPREADGASTEGNFIDLVTGAFTAELGISGFIPELDGGRGGFFVGSGLRDQTIGDERIVLHVPASLLSEFWRSLALGPDSSISVIREDGILVARHPVPADTLDLSDHVLFTEHLPSASSGIYRSSVSPADGVSRIVAYKTVSGLPLVAVAALSTGHVLGPYWQRLYLLLLLGTPVLLLLAGLAGWQAVLLRRDEIARQKLQESAERNRLLLREVHHRVKNNLQIIVSMIRLQNLPAEAERDLRNRIMAMSALHEHLQGPGPAGKIELGSYLADLMEGVNAAYGDEMTLILNLDPDVFVDADLATPLGLIANELVTNANKYAFPNAPPGTMKVRLAHGGEYAELSIGNDGIPFDADPRSKGEGIRLIRSLAQQVNPDFVFSGEKGLDFRIRVPLYRERSGGPPSTVQPLPG